MDDAAPAPLPPVDEQAEQLLRTFGEHKLMDRVQATLRAQLEAQLARVDTELREAEEAREAARVRREDAGVELYGVQQQLARLQGDLDAKAAAVAAHASARATREAELARHTATLEARRAAAAETDARLEAFRGELDGISDTVRAVEAYSEEMGAEIALKRREALKSEGAMGEGEKDKAAQDSYIEGLTASVRRAGEQLASLQAQVDAQRREAGVAMTLMAEANGEMDEIRSEKKQLVQQWQSALTALRRRDEALLAIGRTLAAAQAELSGMDAEESNVRRAVGAAQAAHATAADLLEREEADLRHTEAQLVALQRQGAALEERRTGLNGTLEATDAEGKRAAVEMARLSKVVREIDHQRMLVDKTRFGLEDEINEVLNSRFTQEKTARSLLRDATRLVERSHALDVAKAEAENALASVRVEALTVSARVGVLREHATTLNRDVAEKEALVAKMETELRQRGETVEKKLAVVDRLNRKLERFAAAAALSGGDENLSGPLHAEIAALVKATAEARGECETLQRRWLADHTALVAATTEGDIRTTRLRELSSQASLLHQKAIRLDRAIASETSEKKRLEGATKSIRDDMARINALIAKNSVLRDKLSVSAYSSEKAFGEELKDMEREAAAAEARTASLRSECSRYVEDLIEAERQVLAWEKKIALERESQAALDTLERESELSTLEKEVHRMRMRFDALKKEQERLISEMERAVAKRDSIASKHRSSRQFTMAAAAASGRGLVAAAGGSARGFSGTATGGSGRGGKALSGDALTRVGLEHRASALRAEVATRLAALEAADAAVAAAREDTEVANATLAQRAGAVEGLEAALARSQATLAATHFARARAAERAAASEAMLQRYAALESGRLPSVGSGASATELAAVRARVEEAEAASAAVSELCTRLGTAHKELADIVIRVRAIAGGGV